jgi:histidinol-phosphatase (PHP family)
MDKGIEFNTGGIRYKLDNVFADINIFRRYKELGGEKICLGSDAHATVNIADGFKEATELLKDIGFKYLVHFENRKAVFEKI